MANVAGITTPRNPDTKRSEIELGARTLSPMLLDPWSDVVQYWHGGEARSTYEYIERHSIPKDVYLL